jgi:hypothetical protein
MITEDYVSLEVAKLLKEKGFNECTNRYYNAQFDEIRTVSDTFMTYWNNEDRMKVLMMEGAIAIPTYQMVMKWLREVYNIVISIFPTIETDVIVREDYNYTIYKNRTAIYQNCSLTYEQSCEESIKYTLKNLI